MQNTRFVILTGHLNDYPLSDLVGILRHQKKTGRLLIEYPKGPASFYFEEGELVDAELDNLFGLQAICVAVAQPGSPFNFNPLIKPPRRSIEKSLQRVVSELLGCWDESPLQIDGVATERRLANSDRFGTLDDPAAVRGFRPLALPAAANRALGSTSSRTILVMAAAGLMMLGLSTVIAVTTKFKNRPESVRTVYLPADSSSRSAPDTAGERRPTDGRIQKSRNLTARREENRANLYRGNSSQESNPDSLTKNVENFAADNKKLNQDVSPVQSVNVVMQIENGRVLRASIANHKAGMDGYEALALRIARQRRYPAKSTGQESVRINVGQPD